MVVEAAESRGFVGRAPELARLHAALAGAESGGGRVVILGGEAGIGKSRLIERFAEEARERGAQVLVGACLPVGHEALPYLPFVEALRSLVRGVEAGRLPALLGPRRAELSRLLPELASPLGAGPEAEDDRSAQARLFELVLGVFDRLQAGGTTVLVVEDVQWADRSTLDLIAFLVRNLRASPVMIVLSARTDEIAPASEALALVAELERHGAVRIEVPPLTRAEIGRLLEARAGRSATRPVLDTVVARTGGNPFFAEQLVAASEEGGVSSAALPPALRDVLAARLASFDPATRRILRVAAAAGRRTDDSLIAEVAGLPPADVADALREAVARGLLVDVDAVRDGLGGYAFRHALLQEVAYGELLPGERKALHGAWARALEARGEVAGVPVVPGEIAYHWDAARDASRALPALVEAGIADEAMYAFAEARRHYERALELWPSVPDGEIVTGRDRTWVATRAAECAVLTGDAPGAVALGRAAIAELRERGNPDPRREGELNGRLRWFLWEAGDHEGAAAALDEALRLLPEQPPSATRARALAQLAGMRLLTGDYGAAAGTAKVALEHARASAGVAEEALALGVLGWAQAVLGDVESGERTFGDGLDIAVRLGGPEGIAMGYAGLASMLDRVGRTEGALAAAQDGFATVSRLGLARTYGGTLLGHAAKALFNLGRWDEAEAELVRAFALEPAGHAAAWLHVNAARLATNRGDFVAAARHLEAARAPGAPAATRGVHASAVLAAAAELAVWLGDVAAVRGAAVEGLRLAELGMLPDPWLAWLAALALRAEADAAAVSRARQDDEAVAASRAVAGQIEARLRGFERVATGVRDAAITALCRAEIGRLEGQSSGAAWRQVAEAWAAVGRPYPVAYAHFRTAEALLTGRGPRDDAQAELRSAATIALGLSARPLLAEIERLARQARLDLGETDEQDRPSSSPTLPGGGGLGLTSREMEVLVLLAAGWSNQQIADRLFITRKTASVHVSNILGKVGAANRVEAAAIAHRLGYSSRERPPDR